MLSSKLIDEVFQKLFQIKENKICFECDSESPQWASINNGIFLCIDCSAIHRNFGKNLSFVHSLTLDSWTENQLNHMLMGGNAKLKQFFENYNIPKNTPMNYKYKTKVGNFYRAMLKSQVENGVVPQPPSMDEALEIIEINEEEEKSNEQSQQNKNYNGIEPEKVYDNLINYMGIAYKKAGDISKETYIKANEKWNDPIFQEDLSKFKDNTIRKSKEIGEIGLTYSKKGYEGVKKGWGAFTSYLSSNKSKNKDPYSSDNL